METKNSEQQLGGTGRGRFSRGRGGKSGRGREGRSGRGRGGRSGRGGGGRSGRTGRPRREESHDGQLSRKLSKLLRHRIDENGLRDCLRKDGYVPLERVLTLPQFKSQHVTLENIQSVVRDNDKQRFALTCENGSWWIRANQGHSIQGLSDDALLEPITFHRGDDTPMTAVHGTYYKSWPAIQQSGGLSKMSRTHVHLAANLPEAGGVISGMRGSCELVVYVDVRAATLEGGLEFFRSSNGVVLTRGNGDTGLLSMKYFTRVTDRASGKEIWTNESKPREKGGTS